MTYEIASGLFGMGTQFSCQISSPHPPAIFVPYFIGIDFAHSLQLLCHIIDGISFAIAIGMP